MNKKLAEAMRRCMVGSGEECNRHCPLYNEDDCYHIVRDEFTKFIEPYTRGDEYIHEWDVDLNVTPPKTIGKKKKVDPMMPRTKFIERDQILDEIEDTRNYIDIIESAWQDTRKDFVKLNDEMHDRHVDEILGSMHERDYSILVDMGKRHEKEYERLNEQFNEVQDVYLRDIDIAHDELEAAMDKLAEWDKTHDVEGNPIERDDWAEMWKKKNEEMSFVDYLKKYSELNDADIEAAKDIKTYGDLIKWLCS